MVTTPLGKIKSPPFGRLWFYNRLVQHNLSGVLPPRKEVMRMEHFSFSDMMLFASFVLALLTFIKKK